MEDQSTDKPKRRKPACAKAKRNANLADADNTGKGANAAASPLVTNNTGYEQHATFAEQSQLSDDKVAQLPNVSQILNVPNETQTVSTNGAQPLPPISTVAGRFCNPNFANIGAFPSLGLPNLTNIALPAGMPLTDVDMKQNSSEVDPSAIPIGVVSVPNLNFVPFHVGEMSLFTDSNGSVCAAPSGFHMPFHVPFSGIISIPSAVLTTPIDGNGTTATTTASINAPAATSATSANVVAADVKVDASHAPFGVQLGNAQAFFSNATHTQPIFSGTQSPALFGTQMPTFTAAFVSQPFAFLGPPAVNMAGALPTASPLTATAPNGTPLLVSTGQPCAPIQNVPVQILPNMQNEVPNDTLDKLTTTCSTDAQSTTTQKTKHKHESAATADADGGTQGTVSMRMSSLDEVFAQFTDANQDEHEHENEPPAIGATKSQTTTKKRPSRPRKPKAKVSQPATGEPPSANAPPTNAIPQSAQPAVKVPKRVKPKRPRRNDVSTNQASCELQAQVANGAPERAGSTLDDEILELLRSVVESDDAQEAKPDVNGSSVPENGTIAANGASNANEDEKQLKRSRSTLTDSQRSILEAAFAQSCRLSKDRVAQIALEVCLPEASVLKYFASARRRASKLERPAAASNHTTESGPSPTRPPKRRPLRGTNGPITNFMRSLNEQFFDNVIIDGGAVRSSESVNEQMMEPCVDGAREPGDRIVLCDAGAGKLVLSSCNEPLSNPRCGAFQTNGRSVHIDVGRSKCDDENDNVRGLCTTDISAMFAALPPGSDTDADTDLPADIVLPTIDTSLLPALDGAGSINILSAATAMLPSADELSLNLELAVCATEVKQSG